MRTTLNIDNDLIERASEMTGIKEKTALVRLGLEALIARESAKRLARLGGSEKDLKALSSQLLSSEEKIRKNIALELHDSIGQYLSTIKFNAEACLTKMRSQERLRSSVIRQLHTRLRLDQNRLRQPR